MDARVAYDVRLREMPEVNPVLGNNEQLNLLSWLSCLVVPALARVGVFDQSTQNEVAQSLFDRVQYG